MKLAISLANLRPGATGGAETYVAGLLTALRHHREVTALTLIGNPRVLRAVAGSKTSRRVRHHAISGLPSGPSRLDRIASASRLAFYPSHRLRSVAVSSDVIHYPVAIAQPRCALPRVVTLHDVAHHVVPQYFGRTTLAYRRVAYDRAAQRADAVITVSQHAKQELIEHLQLDPRVIHAIPPGLDTLPAVPEPSVIRALRKRLPRRFVLYPANAWPHKNHSGMIAAMSHLPDQSLHLILTGQLYNHRSALEEEIAAHRLSERVHHLGYVGRDELFGLYHLAQGLVFPSMFEGFGIPPLEAMHFGCPVAASDIGALRETCGGGAMYFDPCDPVAIAEAISRLSNDDDLRAGLRAAGARRTLAFSWDAAAAEHLLLYRQLTAQGS